MRANEELNREGDLLYDQYARPLEAEHWGEFVAIMPDGRTLLAGSLTDAFTRSLGMFGRGSFIFKVGPRAAVRLLSPRLASAQLDPRNSADTPMG